MSLLRRARFVVWCLRVRVALRRHGARLVLDAPHGARLRGSPSLDLTSRGEGDATFHLRIGRNVTIGRDVRLRVDARGTNRLDLGDGAVLQDGVRLWLFSGSISIGRGTILRDLAVLKTGGDLRLGELVRIGVGTVLHCHEEVDLAERVVLADHITLVDSDHVHDGSDAWFMKQPVTPGPVRIGRNTLVGAGSVITRGARLGRNSVVAAGAVVRSGEYPDGRLVGGVPAKPLRPLREDAPQP